MQPIFVSAGPPVFAISQSASQPAAAEATGQCLYRRSMSTFGVKQTSRGLLAMSAYDPEPTSAIGQSVMSRDALDVLRQ